MADNSASSTNQRDISELWASLLNSDEPLWLPLTDAPSDTPATAQATMPAPCPNPLPPTDPSAVWDSLMDERSLEEQEADYQRQDWTAAPTYHPTIPDRRHAGKATVVEVLTELQPRISAAGEVTWFQLTRAVRQVGGDEYKVRRIAEELADAGVAIIERPRHQMATRGAMTDAEEAGYEQIARAVFAHLPRRAPSWEDVAFALGKLQRKVAPDLRPRLITYYNQHQLNRTTERALFNQLDALREAHPELDPRTHYNQTSADAARLKSLYAAHQHCHKQAEKAELYSECLALKAQLEQREAATLGRWRRLPQVAAIYDTICTDQLWSVARNALRYQSEQMPFDDLFQEGCLGVLRAIDTFAPTLNVRFTIYANTWATQRMRRMIDENMSLITMPIHVMEQYHAGYKAFIGLRREIGCSPTSREIDAAAGLKRGTWRRLQGLINVLPLEGCPAALQLVDDAPDLFALVAEVKQGRTMLDMIDTVCTEKERQMLQLRYGITDDRTRTLEEIAHEFGITRERVRQIINKALYKVDKVGRRWGLVQPESNTAAGKLAMRNNNMAASDVATIIHNALNAPPLAYSRADWGRRILRRIVRGLIDAYSWPTEQKVLSQVFNLDCLAAPDWVAHNLRLPFTRVQLIIDAFIAYLNLVFDLDHDSNTKYALVMVIEMLSQIRSAGRKLHKERDDA